MVLKKTNVKTELNTDSDDADELLLLLYDRNLENDAEINFTENFLQCTRRS